MHFNVSHQFENINIEQDTVFIYSQERKELSHLNEQKEDTK